MSGSGPTVYGLFDTEPDMDRAYEALLPDLHSGELSDLVRTRTIAGEQVY